MNAAVADVGAPIARTAFLCAEREFWMSRCEIGLFLGRRQEAEAIDWDNVEHHVACCSREHYHLCAQILSSLDYKCGDVSLAGDGVMQAWFQSPNPGEDIVLEFDNCPDDDANPSSLTDLVWPERSGLWRLLHGDSFLQGGFARVSANYRAARLHRQLARSRACLLSPLAQYDTGAMFAAAGRPLPISPLKLTQMLRQGFLSREAAENFAAQGAIAAHLICADAAIQTLVRARRFDLLLDSLSGSLGAGKPAQSRRRLRLRRKAPSKRRRIDNGQR